MELNLPKAGKELLFSKQIPRLKAEFPTLTASSSVPSHRAPSKGGAGTAAGTETGPQGWEFSFCAGAAARRRQRNPEGVKGGTECRGCEERYRHAGAVEERRGEHRQVGRALSARTARAGSGRGSPTALPARLQPEPRPLLCLTCLGSSPDPFSPGPISPAPGPARSPGPAPARPRRGRRAAAPGPAWPELPGAGQRRGPAPPRSLLLLCGWE